MAGTFYVVLLCLLLGTLLKMARGQEGDHVSVNKVVQHSAERLIL